MSLFKTQKHVVIDKPLAKDFFEVLAKGSQPYRKERQALMIGPTLDVNIIESGVNTTPCPQVLKDMLDEI
jgi:hypothetical protein